jgi:hypothetical protein
MIAGLSSSRVARSFLRSMRAVTSSGRLHCSHPAAEAVAVLRSSSRITRKFGWYRQRVQAGIIESISKRN